ncbi:phosphotransferase family protein [Pseudomonas synxantha]|uniref:Phosphotransferase family protein n=1 Tax=Pseudomonas synxantha TaxID=47883 RepID=A0A5D3GDQ8_9PSED|nr:phosphotransferase family protein [Pseudomonas synxantha]TYK57888.1 phosphotransferase family protein [Pseudomonas synxantha]
MSDISFQKTIELFIARSAPADQVVISDFSLLSGGAIQQNWAIDAQVIGGPFAGELNVVLRTDAPSAVAASHGRAQEFALLRAASQAGVLVPEPLWLGETEIIGRPFFIMRRIKGSAAGHRLVKDQRLGGDRVRLAEQLGEQLARIHSISPARNDLAFLSRSESSPAQTLIQRAQDFLDKHTTPHPILEWCLRWLELNAPPSNQQVLCHRDYRTGNYMVDEQGLTGILDWEFAGWSDPLEDIGWFCAKCWRFGNDAAQAGGVGQREDFYRGYERIAQTSIAREHVLYWEVMAHLNWALIAIQQAERHVSGQERSLNLALTGHIVPELEWEILNLTEYR